MSGRMRSFLLGFGPKTIPVNLATFEARRKKKLRRADRFRDDVRVGELETVVRIGCMLRARPVRVGAVKNSCRSPLRNDRGDREKNRADSDFRYNPTENRRDGRVAEGGGLLNRYRVKSSIGGSNPPLSAIYRNVNNLQFTLNSETGLKSVRASTTAVLM
jgi:hypothetical protein